jgi:predicted MFS family arabinose efflux permease
VDRTCNRPTGWPVRVSTSTEWGSPGVTAAVHSAIPRRVLLLFASACGLSVANIYFADPLLDAMARDLAISSASIGIVVSVTQIGYALSRD